jgi:hypothetical protein
MVSDASPGIADPKMNDHLFILCRRLENVDMHRMDTCGVPIQQLLREICGWTVVGFWVDLGL